MIAQAVEKYQFDRENHVHLLDGRPLMGTSTVTKIISKPLTWWAAGMAVGKLGWTNGKVRVGGRYQTVPIEDRLKISEPIFKKVKTLDSKGYLALLDEAYRAHDDRKKEAAEDGTNRHALLEAYVKDCMRDGGKPISHYEDVSVRDFAEWAKKNIRRFLWSEMHCYSKALWTGGICDVGWENLRGEVVAADFKSSKAAYFDQWIQIGGYDLAISENGGFTSEGVKIFDLERPISTYCVIPFGADRFMPEIMMGVSRYRQAFSNAVYLHKLSQE